MDGNVEQRVRELGRRLESLEAQLSDLRNEDKRRRRQGAWARIGLLLVLGGAYLWYLVRTTSPF